MVAGLFDHYAEHFDEHLVNKLGYKTPDMIL
jgi:predicted TPR repeat methyltransferase